MEKSMEGEWLHITVNEYGEVVESSYIPLVGSRIDPAIPLEPLGGAKHVRFQIDEKGVIVNASPANLNGHRVILHGRSSPALGRTDTAVPTCIWRSDGKGGWACG